MKGQGLGAVAIAMLVIGGCSSDTAQVHSRAAQQVRLTVGRQCPIEYETLAIAAEAYWASVGGPPPSQGMLVVEGLLLDEIDDFDLVVNDQEYDLVPTGACNGFDPTVDTVPAAGEAPADEMNCAGDLKALQVAWEAYNADTGSPPASEEDLVAAGFIRHLAAGFDLVGGEIVPVPGVCG